jgi:hypothetical protein
MNDVLYQCEFEGCTLQISWCWQSQPFEIYIENKKSITIIIIIIIIIMFSVVAGLFFLAFTSSLSPEVIPNAQA